MIRQIKHTVVSITVYMPVFALMVASCASKATVVSVSCKDWQTINAVVNDAGERLDIDAWIHRTTKYWSDGTETSNFDGIYIWSNNFAAIRGRCP